MILVYGLGAQELIDAIQRSYDYPALPVLDCIGFEEDIQVHPTPFVYLVDLIQKEKKRIRGLDGMENVPILVPNLGLEARALAMVLHGANAIRGDENSLVENMLPVPDYFSGGSHTKLPLVILDTNSPLKHNFNLAWERVRSEIQFTGVGNMLSWDGGDLLPEHTEKLSPLRKLTL
jgi:hypothetical protein